MPEISEDMRGEVYIHQKEAFQASFFFGLCLEIILSAESEGFKPPERTSRSADFESAPIDHSGNFPCFRVQKYNIFSEAPDFCGFFFEKSCPE